MADDTAVQQVEELRQIRELITEIRDMERQQLEQYEQSVATSLELQRRSLVVRKSALAVLGVFILFFVAYAMGWLT